MLGYFEKMGFIPGSVIGGVIIDIVNSFPDGEEFSLEEMYWLVYFWEDISDGKKEPVRLLKAIRSAIAFSKKRIKI